MGCKKDVLSSLQQRKTDVVFACLRKDVRLGFIKGGIKKMASENVEKAKTDVKKGVADLEKAGSYLKADINAGVEKAKASLGHNELGKKVEYAKADIKADVQKTKAEIKHASADAKANADEEKARADRAKKR
jgi:hypothetical protein